VNPKISTLSGSTCLNLVTSRFCHDSCADSDIGRATWCCWHRLEQTSRAESKDLSFLALSPLVVEVPPTMPPRFERTLKTLVTPALANGQKLAIMCLPSARRLTQKATWVDHWNRRFGEIFKFVHRCVCVCVRSCPTRLNTDRSLWAPPRIYPNTNATEYHIREAQLVWPGSALWRS